MKIVIQCAGQKRQPAGTLKGPTGEEIVFVACPELCPPDGTSGVRYCRPDDLVGPGLGTWRESLVAYNQDGENRHGLCTAAELYRPRIYRDLVLAFGSENVFILSAGWGLIRSDFLTPDYNITFSTQKNVPAWARRSKRLTLPPRDLNHLTPTVTSPDEPIHFFGGRDYLPLFSALMEFLPAKVDRSSQGKPAVVPSI